jgi:hypothetical protein
MSLGEAAGLGQVVDEVVTQAVEEARLAPRIDQSLGLAQGGDRPFRLALFDEGSRLLDQGPAGEMGILQVRASEAVDLGDLVTWSRSERASSKRRWAIRNEAFRSRITGSYPRTSPVASTPAAHHESAFPKACSEPARSPVTRRALPRWLQAKARS